MKSKLNFVECREQTLFSIWSRSYQTFFLRKHKIFPFSADKLGCLYSKWMFPLCNKHSNLKAKIGKQRKANFGRIDSCLCYLLISKNHSLGAHFSIWWKNGTKIFTFICFVCYFSDKILLEQGSQTQMYTRATFWWKKSSRAAAHVGKNVSAGHNNTKNYTNTS